MSELLSSRFSLIITDVVVLRFLCRIVTFIITWIVGGESCSTREITVPRVPAGVLVDEIHGVGGVGGDGVWLETGSARLDRAAIDVCLRTSVVYVGLQPHAWHPFFWHTPPQQ